MYDILIKILRNISQLFEEKIFSGDFAVDIPSFSQPC